MILALVGLVTGLVRTVLRDFGFRVDRTDAGLRRRRGLLTRTDVTVPLARVQAAIVASGPIRDRFGWCELSFQNLARDEGGKGNHMLAPLAHDAEVDRILAEIGWRPLSPPGTWQPVSFAYVWVGMLWLTPLLLAASVQALIIPWAGLGAAILVLGAMGLRYLAWRRTRYLLDGDRLLVRTGWWRRRSTVLPLSKIQSLDLGEDPVSRAFGTANLQFGVAGGDINAHQLPALPRETARLLRDQMLTLTS